MRLNVLLHGAIFSLVCRFILQLLLFTRQRIYQPCRRGTDWLKDVNSRDSEIIIVIKMDALFPIPVFFPTLFNFFGSSKFCLYPLACTYDTVALRCFRFIRLPDKQTINEIDTIKKTG